MEKRNFAEEYPDLLKEWDYEKNEKGPEGYAPHSGKKVWWKCKDYGHEWKAVINDRSRGRDCPYCKKKRVLSGYNDFVTKNPELVAEWHPTKNKKLDPVNIGCGSGEKVWWICSKGHEWKTSVGNRVKGTKCPKCNKMKQNSIPEQIIYYYVHKVFKNAINTYHSDWLKTREIDIYIPEIDQGVEYDGSAFHQDKLKDLEKNNLVRMNSNKLIRIREPKCPDLMDDSIYILINKISSDYSLLTSCFFAP